jgi:hypothetical protein
VKSLKLSKKIVPRTIATATAVHATLEAPGPKSAAGALGYKIVGGTSSSKPAAGAKKAFAPVKKRRVPVIGAMVGASLEESQESSPHGQTTRGSTRTTALRSEPCGQSS